MLSVGTFTISAAVELVDGAHLRGSGIFSSHVQRVGDAVAVFQVAAADDAYREGSRLSVGGGQTFGGASQRAPGQVYSWFAEEFRNHLVELLSQAGGGLPA